MWKYSESNTKPELIDSYSSKKYVYLRRNIKEVEIDNGIKYVYEETRLTLNEYERYLDEIQTESLMSTFEKYRVLNETEHEEIETTELTLIDKIILFFDSIDIIEPDGTFVEEFFPNEEEQNLKKKKNKTFPEKKGYKWKPKFNGTAFVWELIEDENYVPVKDGSDYTLAIPWNSGDRVTKGLWYDVGDSLIWQAIKNGVPSSSDDAKYFDIP